HCAIGERLHCAAARSEVFEGQVQTTQSQIGPDVAQDVRQLQRDTEIERVLARSGAATPEHLDANHPDRRCSTTAVLEPASNRLLVNRIVNRPAEIPDSDDGASPFGGKHEKRIVEARLSGHYATVRVPFCPRQSTARHRSRGTSAAPSVGRCSKSSNRARLTR